MVEGLETRNLLSTAAPSMSAAVAELRQLQAAVATVIKGTISGKVTGITRLSATSQLVTYTGQGMSSVFGKISVTGRHTITTKLIKNKPSDDTYTKGTATAKGTTGAVALTYTGTGHTAANGVYTATWTGTALETAGQAVGLKGTFVAQVSGNVRTGVFSITFTIKV